MTSSHSHRRAGEVWRLRRRPKPRRRQRPQPLSTAPPERQQPARMGSIAARLVSTAWIRFLYPHSSTAGQQSGHCWRHWCVTGTDANTPGTNRLCRDRLDAPSLGRARVTDSHAAARGEESSGSETNSSVRARTQDRPSTQKSPRSCNRSSVVSSEWYWIWPLRTS